VFFDFSGEIMMRNTIQWINGLSTRPSLEGAVTEVVAQIKQSLSGTPDLGIVFISSAYSSEYPRLVPLILEQLPLKVIIGCDGGGVVGMNSLKEAQEVEQNPALSLTVAYLPEIEVHPFHIRVQDIPDLDSPPLHWINLMGVPPEKEPEFILLSDPFASKINDLLAGLDFAYSTSTKVGGLASSGVMGALNGLFYHTPEGGSQLYREGTIGVALSGNIKFKTIVAQGCRPIGEPYQVTQQERNIIIELGEITSAGTEIKHRPPLEVLREVVQGLNESDRLLAQNSLFIGIVRNEFKLKLKAGDFVVRNVLGVDPRSGAIAIGDRIRPGQRIQFHLRDAQTSAEDLEQLLKDYTRQDDQKHEPIGALIFSCLGRGYNLYKQPNFDSHLFGRYLPHLSLSGFFCNGEIGPISGQTFLHGYTSVFCIICSKFG
jgi:small ligand-binding sensory domain FIST